MRLNKGKAVENKVAPTLLKPGLCEVAVAVEQTPLTGPRGQGGMGTTELKWALHPAQKQWPPSAWYHLEEENHLTEGLVLST
jgi:hypothetical protein